MLEPRLRCPERVLAEDSVLADRTVAFIRQFTVVNHAKLDTVAVRASRPDTATWWKWACPFANVFTSVSDSILPRVVMSRRGGWQALGHIGIFLYVSQRTIPARRAAL